MTLNSLQCSQALVDLHNFADGPGTLVFYFILTKTEEEHKRSYGDIPLRVSHESSKIKFSLY